jgi:hypothetical protein
MRRAANIYWLGLKELRSFLQDYVLLGLVIYAFSLAVILQARSFSQELHNASIAVVDEDHSELSRRITTAFLPPLFSHSHKFVVLSLRRQLGRQFLGSIAANRGSGSRSAKTKRPRRSGAR